VSVLPALPGTPLIFCGVLLVARWGDFTVIGVVPIIVCGVLAGLALIMDFAATALGAKRVGASRLAIIGAMLGTFVGAALIG
jgi:uncharacterized protein YqgC (DUF456 family)